MKKYFLFRKEEVSAFSVTASDSGIGLSLLAVPTDSVSYISSELGKVKVVFNNVSIYEEANLRDGESLEKSYVFIGCEEGGELDLVESMIKFMTSEKTASNVMRFDVVDGKSTLAQAVLETVSPVVHRRPINMQTGDISTKANRDAEDSALIAGIDFGVNQPLVDYNHEGLSAFADTAEITSWANAGSGGATYNISSNVGDPACTDPSVEQRGLTTKAAFFVEGEHFIVPTINVEGDYTLYMVFDKQYTATLYSQYLLVAYGDAAGETLGPNGVISKDGTDIAGGPLQTLNTFQARHSGQTGVPASTSSSVEFPRKYKVGATDADSCHVLIVRRDSEGRMFYHSGFENGGVIGIIQPVKDETSGRLKIERLGTAKDLATNHFQKSSIARFGVIEKDIGVDSAARLAQDLFNLYNF
jgi:hypothetical protein